MADKISSFFICKNLIEEKEKEIYAYSFEMTISFILNFVIVILISLITNTFLYSMLFLFGFLPLRIVAGGYHAKTHFRCMMTLVVIYLVFILGIYLYPSELIFGTAFGVTIFSAAAVCFLAPAEDKNNPLSETQMIKLKYRSRILTMLYTLILIWSLLIVKNPILPFSFALGFLAVALSIFVSKVKLKLTRD